MPPRCRDALSSCDARSSGWPIHCYSPIRGPIAKWYPYLFLNPDHAGGYGVVALYCLGIAIGTLLFTWLVVIVGACLRVVASGAASAA